MGRLVFSFIASLLGLLSEHLSDRIVSASGYRNILFMPTSHVAYLVGVYDADAGIVFSYSKQESQVKELWWAFIFSAILVSVLGDQLTVSISSPRPRHWFGSISFSITTDTGNLRICI